MIAVIKSEATEQQIGSLQSWFHSRGLKTHLSEGDYQTIIGLVGDVSSIDTDLVEGLEIVESVKRISDPFKRANRKFHPKDTIVEVSEQKIGGGNFQIIAGPCSVESPEQILSVAESVQKSGAALLRGGAFKPRTSPYNFQGLRAEGIELLLEAKKVTGMPIVTEIMNAVHLPLFKEVDIIQVGARNMQNFELLKELGQSGKPILLKRGFANTLQELLMSAEYIMSEGNENVILCERGIRTFETYTRNTLDLSAVPVLRELTHLPIIIDPSHAIGVSRFVKPMALAAVASGADGLIIEVHDDPPNASCDGAQSLTPEEFADLAGDVKKVRSALF
ncbi:MAG: 3-deoxy-7-phosphoheptulonate synthase [Oscillospiraceae bacterium]|nr:3-deoxy-7-phosphoheptulonate synthase [Oscillospiraceae bacterium]